MADQKYEIELGSAPSDEACAQVGAENYSARARAECAAYKDQILRHYPMPENVACGIRTSLNPHEFGSYRELSAVYSCFRGEQWAMAIECDSKGVLRTWDNASRLALGLPVSEDAPA